MSRHHSSGYHPPKYYRGLTRKVQQKRRKELTRRAKMSWKDPRAYRPFATNRGVQTRTSSYTQQWRRRFPDARSLQEKANKTGVPVRFLKESYDRGMAAWRTGHRPGATQEQWGYARVHSLLLCGKTYRTTDSDIARRAQQRSRKAKKWFTETCGTTDQSFKVSGPYTYK